MKLCPTCQTEKSEVEFYRCNRSASGLKSQCKVCHTKGNLYSRDANKKREANARHMAKARAENPNKFRERDKLQGRKREKDERYRARYLLNDAVRAGKILKPSVCSACLLEKKLTAHHRDYSKPFDVDWLCYKCHAKEHRHEAE
jgi:hypothetical protein